MQLEHGIFVTLKQFESLSFSFFKLKKLIIRRKSVRKNNNNNNKFKKEYPKKN
jgi:hypothetical protein